MQSLKIEPILALLGNGLQVRSKRCLGNRFCVVEVIHLTLVARLHVDRRDDPLPKTYLAQCAADKMCAQTSLHAFNTARQLLKCCNQRQPLDLLARDALSCRIETHQMNCVFSDIDANRQQPLTLSLPRYFSSLQK